MPLVIAHRGAHDSRAPENSLAAFERAIELGADMVELDVRRTRDGELVVFHDPAVGGVLLADLTCAELSELRGMRPPLLSEAVACVRGRIALMAELKEDGYVAEVLELVEGLDDLLVTSFLEPVVRQVGELASEIASGLLIDTVADDPRPLDDVVARARGCAAGAVDVAVERVGDSLLDEVVDAGLDCYVWDVVPNEHAWVFADPRVRGVTVDDVAGAVALREARPRGR